MPHRECNQQLQIILRFADPRLPIISDLTNLGIHRLVTTPHPRFRVIAHRPHTQDILQDLQIMLENLAGCLVLHPGQAASPRRIQACLGKWRWGDHLGQRRLMGDEMRWVGLRLAWSTILRELDFDLTLTKIGTEQNANEWAR